MKELNHEFTDELIDEYMKIADINEDGRITFEDFKNMLQIQ